MNPARLNKRVWLQRREFGKDGLGQRKEEWFSIVHVWAEIKPLSSSEDVKSNAEVSAITHEIKIRYRSGITSDMRFLRESGRVFDIVAEPINEREQNRYLLCKCVERF